MPNCGAGSSADRWIAPPDAGRVCSSHSRTVCRCDGRAGRQVPRIARVLHQRHPVALAQVVLGDRRGRPHRRVQHRGGAVDAAGAAGLVSTSSRTTTSASRSDSVCATCSSRVRRVTRQSTRRRRSPAVNRRTPASSPPSPGRRERCTPTRTDERGIVSSARNDAGSGMHAHGGLAGGARRPLSRSPSQATPYTWAGPTACRPQRSAGPASTTSATSPAARSARTAGQPGAADPGRVRRAAPRPGRDRARRGLATRTTTDTSVPSDRSVSRQLQLDRWVGRGRRQRPGVPSANGTAMATRSSRPNNDPSSTSTPASRIARPAPWSAAHMVGRSQSAVGRLCGAGQTA